MKWRLNDSIDDARQTINIIIDVHIQVVMARHKNPDSWPGYCIPLTWDAVTNRIIGRLLECGWTPPPDITDGVDSVSTRKGQSA